MEIPILSAQQPWRDRCWKTSADEFRTQLEVNLVAPTVVIKAFAPLLGTDRTLTGPPGRIVNSSSVEGRFADPFVGLYAASKHGLEGLSETAPETASR